MLTAKRPKLAIYFSKPGVMDYPLNKKVYFEAYSELSEYWDKHNITAVIVRGDSYAGKAEFKHYFVWDQDIKNFKKINEPVRVDLIWNRDAENTIPRILDCPVLNHPELDDICRDKMRSFAMFRQYSAPTFLLNSYQNLLESLPEIKTAKIVLKPRYGEQCAGVKVLDKAQVNADLYPKWNDILLQEFLDSSCGIKGLVSGLHELNIITVNGKFAGARMKQPPPGQFISSATGAVVGKVRGLGFKDIPAALWEIVQSIDQTFAKYPLRLFRADFVFTVENEFKLIEINSRPGVMHPEKEGKEYYWDFNGTLADAIIDYFRP